MRAACSVEISGFSLEGLGTGQDEKGRSWVIRGAAPGSRVKAGGKPKSGVVLSVERPALDRVEPACPVADICGGCQWQEVPLLRQRKEKYTALQRALGVGTLVGGAQGFYWRNKMEFSFGTERFLSAAEHMAGTNRVGRWLGLHAPGRFDRVVDLEECPLMSAGMNRVFKSIRQDVLSNVWPIWNHREAAGFWRHLVVREGENGVIASLHTTTGTAEQQSWLLERAQAWGAAGVRWLQNDAVGDAVGGTISCLHGDTIVVEHLAGIEFRLSADAFFQVNREGAELLVATIGRLAGMGKTLLDLYCGTGAIGLGLASQFERVIGIELFEPSVVAARENAARNGVMAEYYCGAVEEVIKTLVIPEKPVVVVDPPRAGLHPKALAFLAGLDAEALVYVACKPASLVRDRLVLEGAGWTLSEWVAVDMFPQTGHVEVVARFEPQGTQRTQRTQRIGDYLGCSPTE